MRPNVWLSIDFDFFVYEDPSWEFGHSETQLGIDKAWTIRLAQHRIHKVDLLKEMTLRKAKPTPGAFWKTLQKLGYRFDKTKSVSVADSHKWAYHALRRRKGEPKTSETRIVHFDAHHDLFYSINGLVASVDNDDPSCENWHFMTLDKYPKLESLVVYPAWKGMHDWDESMGRFIDLATPDGKDVLEILANRVTPVVWPDPRVAEAAGDVTRIFICRSGAWVPPWHDRAFQRFCAEAEHVCGRPVRHLGPPMNKRKIDMATVNDAVLLEMAMLGLIGSPRHV